MLTIIAISNIVHSVPVLLIQAGLGIIAAAFPGGLHISLSPELFFVLFIAPLLFHDGRRILKKEIHLKSVQIIRNEIQQLFESRQISRETAYRLRQYMNDPGASMLDE